MSALMKVMAWTNHIEGFDDVSYDDVLATRPDPDEETFAPLREELEIRRAEIRRTRRAK